MTPLQLCNNVSHAGIGGFWATLYFSIFDTKPSIGLAVLLLIVGLIAIGFEVKLKGGVKE